MFWNNSSTAVNLLPANAGYTGGIAEAISGTQQVGFVNTAQIPSTIARAALWNGSAASFVSLHPGAAYSTSTAFGTDGSQQVGAAALSGVDHAMLWQGTAASAVDLQPLFATDSTALATNGIIQVGHGTVAGSMHAIAWAGSAATAIDLNPSYAASSLAMAVNGTQVGGRTTDGINSGQRATLWTTPLTPVDLHPAGASYSIVRDLSDTLQVGQFGIGGRAHAAV